MTTPSRFARFAVLALALAATLPVLPARPTSAAMDAARVKNRRKMRAVLRRKGLAKLPSVGAALAGRVRKHAHHMMAEVTGTPPTLVSIPDQSIKDLFWQPGVLDAIIGGTASPSQCGQFWVGDQDGESGGLGACRMAQDVGYSLGDVLSGDGDLCYMKHLPTPANVHAGGVTLVAGSFPDDDPTRLFSVPAGSTPRIVKVAVSGQQHDAGQTVFLRVYSDGENQTAGDLYAVDLWFCPANAPAKGFDRIRIANSGQFTVEMQEGHDDGANVATVDGFVTFANGLVVYDTSQSRHAATASQNPTGAYKADHVIAPDNTIATKSYNVYGSGTNKSYVVASFSGSGAEDLRFLAGAFKERNSGDPSGGADVVGSTEYRGTLYAASPGSALESRLTAVDLGSDDFYATPPAVTVDASAFDCNAVPDVAVAVDFANPAIAPVQAQCEQRAFQNMQFCYDDPTVQSAETHFGASCSMPH